MMKAVGAVSAQQNVKVAIETVTLQKHIFWFPSA